MTESQEMTGNPCRTGPGVGARHHNGSHVYPDGAASGPAARQVSTLIAPRRPTRSPVRTVSLMIIVGIGVLALTGACEKKKPPANEALTRYAIHEINGGSFDHICQAQTQNDLRRSAAETETALSKAEYAFDQVKGFDLDPRIRDFAQLQAKLKRSLAEVVGSEQEIAEHPERVPLELLQMMLKHRQAARQLAEEYRPDWVKNLDRQIDHIERAIKESEQRSRTDGASGIGRS